ncbi:GTP-binding protein [Hydrogenoanaerobacterium saccharovorans]|uniref:Large ribosomal subunit assembly factor BipA n=1 Tax=Hydrogenoanaerobacterium saccharovorans TaxID=474960 RepID=A0A1H8BTT5_9FIRM|nr:translational GTPase TypA [Hydrogenoanaerobacterium saccharovorans]RPF47238.1 GTP-binding protein [Hydrogenoanaerobacterium saccharovorans]SEM86196.1 GTP-binding protein [Hydrogenoanaerobacterium saccharovorans]
MIREDLRNVAIIAHVDHGKTTLVDEMLKQGGVFRDNQVVADRVMDNNDLERERGITILAKNTAAHYKGVKINIIDTPGHADFGGEVERVLKMVNGVLLLVDAFEGPMPQTRFVLQKALELGHKIIIVVNKVDKPGARPAEVADEVLELLLDLDASDEQLESPVVYCSGRTGTASLNPQEEGEDLTPMFETILSHIPGPEGDPSKPLQMLVSSIDYNEYVGRIAIGRIEHGSLKANQEVTICDYHKEKKPFKSKVANIYQIEGLKRVPADEVSFGDIVCFSGVENITIGDTVCQLGLEEPLPFMKISEPTVEMTFAVNDSPFAGREGKFVTSRQLRDRLFRELLKDVSLRVNETESTDSFRVCGRGEMHLSILIETMRREGYEFQVSTPKVLYKEIEGKLYEPMEELVIDVPEESLGSVMEKMGSRKGELTHMQQMGSRFKVEFIIPSRGLFGYRSEFMTDTRGEGIMSAVFHDYQPYKGDIPKRATGSLIVFETGESITYGLYNAQERGVLFIGAGVPVYEGMVIGSNPKGDDMAVNVCKKKQMTNTRASGSDDALRLVPPRRMSLEDSLEFISDDELVEVTPKSIRLRKKILDNNQRMKASNKKI